MCKTALLPYCHKNSSSKWCIATLKTGNSVLAFVDTIELCCKSSSFVKSPMWTAWNYFELNLFVIILQGFLACYYTSGFSWRSQIISNISFKELSLFTLCWYCPIIQKSMCAHLVNMGSPSPKLYAVCPNCHRVLIINRDYSNIWCLFSPKHSPSVSPFASSMTVSGLYSTIL